MKHRKPSSAGSTGAPPRTHDSEKRSRPRGATLFQVYPVPTGRREILAVVTYLINKSAAACGKKPPELSEDAATFLSGRRWELHELALRVSRAVANNEGSLITAHDLSRRIDRNRPSALA